MQQGNYSAPRFQSPSSVSFKTTIGTLTVLSFSFSLAQNSRSCKKIKEVLGRENNTETISIFLISLEYQSEI